MYDAMLYVYGLLSLACVCTVFVAGWYSNCIKDLRERENKLLQESRELKAYENQLIAEEIRLDKKYLEIKKMLDMLQN